MIPDEERRKPIPPVPSRKSVGQYFADADSPLDLNGDQLTLNSVASEAGHTNLQISNAILTDGLTDLPNVDSAPQHFRIAYNNCKRLNEDSSLAVVMVDLDYFKKINDNYGHSKGDDVLKAVGRVFKKILRANQVAARYGGEEFFLILPNLPTPRVSEILEQIHKNFTEGMNIEFPELRITASMGAVSLKCPLPDEPPEELYKRLHKRADELLYEAKDQGRNKILFNPMV